MNPNARAFSLQRVVGVVVVTVVLCLASSYAAIKYDRTRHAPLGELLHEIRVSSFSSTHADVVMVGDSITQYGNWPDYFPGVRIANRGVGGDTTADAIENLHWSYETNARRAIVMLGTNDILQGRPIKDTIEDYRLILVSVRRHLESLESLMIR